MTTMLDLFTSLAAASAPGLWMVIALTALIKLVGYRKRRLLRCPESGSVTLVEIGENTHLAEQTAGKPRLRVKNCQLWPERKGCGWGCLTRCSEGWQAYGFNLSSLKPFEDHESKQPASLQHQS
jgi:hypothetical protein